MKVSNNILPVGKLPPELLARVLAAAPVEDERLLVGPGFGFDCAVVDLGAQLLVFKSDPITFATDEIGWYAVQVNANDLATSGALPSWFLMTLLLPEGGSTPELVQHISQQVFRSCQEMGVSVIGGHSEITPAVSQVVIAGTMIGEVAKDDLITPAGAKPGDTLLLTKGVPIEAVSILAREIPEQLSGGLNPSEIKAAQNYLYQPGISVLKDARIATRAGEVTAMHDPTEGGLAAALWELAAACGHDLVICRDQIPVPELAERICAAMDIDVLSSIASGALLLSTPNDQSGKICQALADEGIPCHEIGKVESGKGEVWVELGGKRNQLPYPERDEIARLFESG